MHWQIAFSRHFFTRTPAWDRLTVQLLWCLKLKIDRAWLDDRQYNPLNWVPVIIWRQRHPIWINRIGIRIDRLMVDFKLGMLWLSRTRGERATPIIVTKKWKQAQAWVCGTIPKRKP